MTSIRRVGVLGLGRMGLPMSRHLRRAGFEVAGYDPDAERLRLLEAEGGRPAATAAEAARGAQAVLVVVADDAQVRSAVLGADGAAAALAPGAVIVIASTVQPSTCREVAERLAPAGLAVLDAPVALGQRAAEEGRLTTFVGGPREVVERTVPVLRAYAREVVHIGEAVGSGQVAKMANNLILWAGVVAVHESLALAERLGVSPSRLRDALRHGSADGYALRELHRINLTWPHKDIEQALETAAAAGVALPLAGRVGRLIRGLTKEELRRLCQA